MDIVGITVLNKQKGAKRCSQWNKHHNYIHLKTHEWALVTANIIKTLKICKIYNIFSNVIVFVITRYVQIRTTSTKITSLIGIFHGGSEHFIAKSFHGGEYLITPWQFGQGRKSWPESHWVIVWTTCVRVTLFNLQSSWEEFISHVWCSVLNCYHKYNINNVK